MRVTLSAENEEAIFQQIKLAYSDFVYFEQIVAIPLRRLIHEVSSIDITVEVTKNLVRTYYDVTQFRTDKEKQALDFLEILLTSCYVLILHDYCQELQSCKLGSIELLLQHYKDFSSITDMKELNFLLKFRNMMKIALTIVPPKNRKLFLIKVVERLEGSNEEYITGSGQKIEVTRRVMIYEQEGNIKPRKIGSKRKDPPMDTSSSSKKERTVAFNPLPTEEYTHVSHNYPTLQQQEVRFELDKPPASITCENEAPNIQSHLPNQTSFQLAHSCSMISIDDELVYGEDDGPIEVIQEEEHTLLLREGYVGSFTEVLLNLNRNAND